MYNTFISSLLKMIFLFFLDIMIIRKTKQMAFMCLFKDIPKIPFPVFVESVVIQIFCSYYRVYMLTPEEKGMIYIKFSTNIELYCLYRTSLYSILPLFHFCWN